MGLRTHSSLIYSWCSHNSNNRLAPGGRGVGEAGGREPEAAAKKKEKNEGQRAQAGMYSLLAELKERWVDGHVEIK